MTDLNIHELTAQGMEAAYQHLVQVKNGADEVFPASYLTEMPYARQLSPSTIFEKRDFENRRELAKYLAQKIEELGDPQVVNNYGFWSWLGMYYFLDLVRRDPKGKPAANFLIPCFLISERSSTALDRNRHYFLIAHLIYQKHKEAAAYLLEEKVNSWSNFDDRVTGRQALFNSQEAIKVVMALYTRNAKERKKGAVRGSSGGTLPRLFKIFDQLERTYDIYTMDSEKILDLLPSEFDPWKPPNR